MGVFADYARKYHEAGYSILPTNGKHPFKELEGYQKFSEENPDEDTIDQWESKFPDANISIVLGKASNLIALDFDYEGNDYEAMENIVLGLVPPTPVEKKGRRGWTKFYKYNGIQSTKKDRNNKRFFDLLSDSKYTVVPPSIHPDTKRKYAWVCDSLLEYSSIDLPEISIDIIAKLKDLADMDIVNGENPFEIKSGRHDRIMGYAWKIIEKVNSVEELAEKMIEYDKIVNNQNTYFTDKKYFRQKSAIDAAIYTAKKFEKSAIRYRKKKHGIDWKIGKKIDKESLENKTNTATLNEFIKLTSGYYESVVAQNGSIRDVPLYNELGYDLKRENIFRCSDSGNYVFNNGYWNFIDKTEFHNIIRRINQGQGTPFHLDNFMKVIKADCFYNTSNHDSKKESGFVNLKNGILDIRNKKLIPHNSDFFFRQIIPIEYDESKVCDRWIEFLNYVLRGDKDLISLIQQMFGYVLIGGEPFLHKAFVLYGSGRNGKSTLIEILRDLLGSLSYSTVSLSKIHREFSAVELVGKMANLIEETPQEEINSEIFKSIVGGGNIQVSYKNHNEFSAKINARFIFACNDMPIFKDKNSSMLDRLVLIPFDVYIKEEDRDTELLSKLRQELSGILNWALVGANEILKTRKLITPQKSFELKEQYKEETDPVYAWFMESIEPGNIDIGEYSNDLYVDYVAYAEKNNNYPVSAQKFYKRIKSLCESDKDKFLFFSRRVKDRTVERRTIRNLSFFTGVKLKRWI